MRTLHVQREYEVAIPDRNTMAWTELEAKVREDCGDDEGGQIDAGYILSDDEHVATWLSYQADVGNMEILPGVPHTTMGACMIGECAFDPKVYRSVLDEVKK
jgi:hypothetical protein